MIDYKTKIRENDYKAGKKAEDDLCELLNNNNIISTETDKFCWYDFLVTGQYGSKKYLIEHKWMFVKKDKYPTTIIPYSKVKEWRKVKKSYDGFLLIFTFNDGRHFINYKTLMKLKKVDKNIKVDWFQRYSGYKHKIKKHLFIPVTHLQPFNENTLKTT